MPLKAKQTTQSSCVFRKNTNCSVGALLLRSPRCKTQDVELSVEARKQLTDASKRTGAALERWSPSAPLYPSVGRQHWGQEGQHESQIPVWFVNCRDIDLQGCSDEWNPLAASMTMGRVQRECNLTADCSGEEGQSSLLLWLKPFLYVSCAAPHPAGPWVITKESIYCVNFNNGGQNCMVMAYGYSWLISSHTSCLYIQTWLMTSPPCAGTLTEHVTLVNSDRGEGYMRQKSTQTGARYCLKCFHSKANMMTECQYWNPNNRPIYCNSSYFHTFIF